MPSWMYRNGHRIMVVTPGLYAGRVTKPEEQITPAVEERGFVTDAASSAVGAFVGGAALIAGQTVSAKVTAPKVPLASPSADDILPSEH